MKKLWLLVLIVLTGPVWAENNSPDEARNRLNQLTASYVNTALFEADFTQTKQVKFMHKPLVSQGRIKFAKNHGLIWIIDQPFESRTWVNQQGVFKANQFEPKKPVNDPQMKAVAGVLSELLSAQVDNLVKKFTVSNQTFGDNALWRITLTPNTMLMKKVLQRIEIIGKGSDAEDADGIQRIVVTDSNQNVTEIEFSQVKRQQKSLTDQQISEF